MFFDKFKKLCEEKGVTPSKAVQDAGINKSAITYWKKSPDSKPTGQTAEKLCKYFGITMSELYGDIPQEKTLTPEGERQISKKDVMFALWGDTDEVDEDDLADVQRYADFIRERKRKK